MQCFIMSDFFFLIEILIIHRSFCFYKEKYCFMCTKEITVTENMLKRSDFAATLISTACHYDSSIHIYAGDICANGKSLMGLMAFPLFPGIVLNVQAEGADEEAAVDAIEKCLTAIL